MTTYFNNMFILSCIMMLHKCFINYLKYFQKHTDESLEFKIISIYILKKPYYQGF